MNHLPPHKDAPSKPWIAHEDDNVVGRELVTYENISGETGTDLLLCKCGSAAFHVVVGDYFTGAICVECGARNCLHVG